MQDSWASKSCIVILLWVNECNFTGDTGNLVIRSTRGHCVLCGLVRSSQYLM